MDLFSSGLDCGGGGASPTVCTPENKEVATSEPASAKEAESAADTPHPWDAEGGTAEALDEQAQQSLSAMLKGYLPLGLIPVNVGRAALAWQPYPQIVYVRFSNGDQRQGFGLRRGCQLTAPLHAALLELRGLERASKFLPMWLRDHPEAVVTSRNFLFIDGDA